MSQPGLPPEIISAIIECAVTGSGPDGRTSLSGALRANHTIYALLSERLYRTAILRSSRMTNKFADALQSSPRMASLLVNIWIATPSLYTFSMQLGSTSNTVARILSKTQNLRRLALHSDYFPRVSAPDAIPPISHLTTTEDLFPLSTPNIPTLLTVHILGPLWPTRTEILIARCPNLQRVTCTIPYTFQTSYVTPAVQCTQALHCGLKSLISIHFRSSKRVAIALKKALADYIDHDEGGVKVHVDILDSTQESASEAWFGECFDPGLVGSQTA